jgi:transglutaminase-like putative cysteine protease
MATTDDARPAGSADPTMTGSDEHIRGSVEVLGSAEPISPNVGVVGCQLDFAVSTPATVVLQIAAARRPGVLVRDRLTITNGPVDLAAQEVVGSDGGRQHIIRVNPGRLTIIYQATLTGSGASPPTTDTEWVEALRPSRYCPSDRMTGFAQSNFGDLSTVSQQVRAICDYVWRHIGYDTTVSGSSTDAVDTLLTGRGVCRDSAHLVAALCRAIDIPARLAAVYAPGLSPMDFHAVVETAIDGDWWAWDATRLAPRPALVRIATGRDAADVAFATVISGQADLRGLKVTAVAADDLPLDDHEQRVPLA